MEILIGQQDTGYSFINNTKQIRLTGLWQTPAIGAIRVKNETTNKSLVGTFMRNITVTQDGDDYIIDYTGNTTANAVLTGDVLSVYVFQPFKEDTIITKSDAIKSVVDYIKSAIDVIGVAIGLIKSETDKIPATITKIDAIKAVTDGLGGAIVDTYRAIIDSGNRFYYVARRTETIASITYTNGAVLSTLTANGVAIGIGSTVNVGVLVVGTTVDNMPNGTVVNVNVNVVGAVNSLGTLIQQAGAKLFITPMDYRYIDSINKHIVLGNRGGSSVGYLYYADSEKIFKTGVAGYPYQSSFNRDNSVYISSLNKYFTTGGNGGAILATYNFTTDVLTSLALGTTYASVKYDINRNKLIVYNANATIQIINPVTNTIVQTVTFGGMVRDIVFIPGADLTLDRYVLCCTNSAQLFNPNDYSFTAITGVATAYHVFLSSDGKVYIAGTTNSYVLNTSMVLETTLTNVATTNGNIYGIADANLYAAFATGTTLKIVTKSDNTIRSVTGISSSISQLNYAPSLNRVLALESGLLQIINPVTASITQSIIITASGSGNYNIYDDTINNMIVIVNQAANQVQFIDKSTIL